MKRVLLNFLIILLALPCSSFSVLAEQGQDSADIQKEGGPEFTEVGVHDPSIIKTDDTFYIFGSHLASAKSDDLIQWDQMTLEVSEDNQLFENVFEELKDVFDWAETDTLWAADVIQLPDGKYYMYYNACKGDSPLSAMGVAVAEDIEGPYKDLGLFLWSGRTPNPMDIEYNIDIHPNVVDPHVFFDKEGQLWMVYGSYSGGIFILEMDHETGFPIEGQGYGKKLTGGGVRIEASYIQYIPETDYYYLYVTFGGLAADGGYNMRIARSKSPDGPYLDAEGQDMIEAIGREGIPFDDEAIEPYGVKLVGNFQYRDLNGTGDFPTYGYVSPGHNSSYYDEETGHHFNIFHTRFPKRGEEHEVRVHLMPMNKNAWPVMAPHRYAGEKVEVVSNDEIFGSYHYINHGKEITAKIKQSEYIELNADGTISGSVTGRWNLEDEHYAQLLIEEDDGTVTYDGVFLRQWDETSQAYVMTFSAISEQGVSIWGSQFESTDDETIVENLINQLSIGYTDRVFDDLTLPTELARGATVTWESSNPEVISHSGEVTRPNIGAGNVQVELTATVHYNGVSRSKEFIAVVQEQVEDPTLDGLIAHYDFDNQLDEVLGHFPESSVTGARMDQIGGQITYAPGAVGEALELDGRSGIRLADGLIQTDVYSVAMWLNPTDLKAISPAFFGAQTDEQWISYLPVGHDLVDGNTMLWSGTKWFDASSGRQIPIDQWTHVAFTVDKGDVTLFLDGEAVYHGSGFPDIFKNDQAKFALGVNYWDDPYHGLIDDLRVYGVALPEETVQLLLNGERQENVQVSTIQLSETEKRLVKDTRFIPEVKIFPINAYNQEIEWRSDNSDIAKVDSTTGEVTGVSEGVTKIVANAKDGSGTTASYQVRVTDGLAAHYNFENNLADFTENMEPGRITGNRITNTNGEITFADGIVGQAAVFDGQSGIRLPNGLISHSRYSLSIWLNPEELTDYSTAFFGARDQNNWLSIVPAGPADSQTMVWSGSDRWYDAPIGRTIATNEWSHLTLTVDHDEIKIYLNGEFVYGGNDFPDLFSSAKSQFSLGVNYWDAPYKGMIDELMVYDNYLLSEDEVLSYYQSIRPVDDNKEDGEDGEEEDSGSQDNELPEDEQPSIDNDKKQEDTDDTTNGQNQMNKDSETDEDSEFDRDNDSDQSSPDRTELELPKTVTHLFNYIMAGLFFLLVGGLYLLFYNKQKNKIIR